MAVAAGVTRYCLLGAGLDTFALRNPWPHLRVLEVDHASMQAWKRELLQAAGITVPRNWVQQPGDLAQWRAGDTAEAAFVSLLGVAPYLDAQTLARVLGEVRGLGEGSGIVVDYRLPRALLPQEEQRQHDSLCARLRDAGEPFVSFWSRDEMAAALAGFSRVEQLGAAELNARYFLGREDGLAVLGEAVQIAIAWV